MRDFPFHDADRFQPVSSFMADTSEEPSEDLEHEEEYDPIEEDPDSYYGIRFGDHQ